MNGGDIVALVSLIIVAIIFGLVMRYGATSVPLAGDIQNMVDTGFGALTLANPQVYPYEGPAGG